MAKRAPGRRTIFTDEEQRTMVALYNSGYGIVKIAEQIGVGYTSARNVLLRLGVQMRPQARKYTVDHNAFDEIDNERAAYWLGFIYADGCVRNTYLQVILWQNDAEHLEKLSQFLGSSKPVFRESYSGVNSYPRARMTVFSKHMTGKLRDCGIEVNRPHPEKTIDAVPSDLFNHWLRGFFDGDGSADKRKSIWFCGKQYVMEIIRSILADQAGRNSQLSISEHSSGTFYLRYKGYYNAHAVADYMYRNATVWLDRKRKVIGSWKLPMTPSERARVRWERHKADSHRT